MRHKASGPLADFYHRIPRAAAYRLERTAERVPVRTLATVMVVSLGIVGIVALSAMIGASSSDQRESAVDPVAPEADAPSPTAQATPPDGGVGPEPGAPPSGQPPAPPPATQAPPGPSTEPTEVTASASAETSPPSSSPPRPTPDGSRLSRNSGPPNTNLSEEYPSSDAAVFRLSADEAASFNCSLDGGAFVPCGSPTRYGDLKPGWHTFAVSAVDSAGNADPTPAETRWLANNGRSGDDARE